MEVAEGCILEPEGGDGAPRTGLSFGRSLCSAAQPRPALVTATTAPKSAVSAWPPARGPMGHGEGLIPEDAFWDCHSA